MAYIFTQSPSPFKLWILQFVCKRKKKVIHECTKCHPYVSEMSQINILAKVIMSISMMFEHPHNFVRQNYKINFLQRQTDISKDITIISNVKRLIVYKILSKYHFLSHELILQDNNKKIIRCRVTATLRRPQINQCTASNEGVTTPTGT